MTEIRPVAALNGDVPAAGRDPGPITRGLILQTALQLVDRDGVDRLSMRRLSEEVGRDTTVPYRHIPDKATLLDGVVETVLAELSVDTADPHWAGQLRTVARRLRTLALAHPNVVPLLVTRPLSTLLGRRPAGCCAPWKTSSPCSPTPGSVPYMPCTSTG